MAEDNTLTKALVDVRARRAALQSDYDRIAAELTKLRAAEAALTSIVEGIPLEASVDGMHDLLWYLPRQRWDTFGSRDMERCLQPPASEAWSLHGLHSSFATLSKANC